MQARQNHFFKADMLRSQFDALEEPSSTIGDDEKLDNKIDAADGDHRTEHKHANPSDAHRVRNGATDGDTRESARAGGVQCKDPVDTSKGDAAIVIDMDDSDLSSVLQIITAINKALQ